MIKDLKDLKLGDLRRYKAMAVDEIREWTKLLKTIEKELSEKSKNINN